MIPLLLISLSICTAAYIGVRYGLWLGEQVGQARGYRRAARDYRGTND
jgi:hypothetical protein